MRTLRVLVGMLALITASPAAMGSPPEETRRADTIYDEARAAFEAGNYATACPLFEEYYALDASPAALFTLAECEARWDKPARALAHFEEFLRLQSGVASTPVGERRVLLAQDQVIRLSARVAKILPSVSS